MNFLEAIQYLLDDPINHKIQIVGTHKNIDDPMCAENYYLYLAETKDIGDVISFDVFNPSTFYSGELPFSISLIRTKFKIYE